MMNDQTQFIKMLRTIPAYDNIFKALDNPTQPNNQAPAEVPDDMPQPDQELTDGSRVYSLEGLKALNAWNRSQARKEVMDEVGKRFGPIEEEWQAHQRIQAIMPKVQAQLDEARKWPLFNESEGEITKALQENQSLSLEGAYQKVVYPKLIADRSKMREDILKEVKQAPRSTAAPTQASRPAPQTSKTNRTLEEVIADSIKDMK